MQSTEKQRKSQLFNAAGQLLSALTRARCLNKETTRKDIKQVIYDALYQLDQDTDNTVIPIQPTQHTHTKQKNQKEYGSDHLRLLATDKDYAQGWLIQQLAASLEDTGNSQAAKQLREMLGIQDNDTLATVEIIDYASMCDDCPKMQPDAPIETKSE